MLPVSVVRFTHAKLSPPTPPPPTRSLSCARVRAHGCSHEEHDVLDDVQAWFPYLRESNSNAVMIGDDYPSWPGVQGERASTVGNLAVWGSQSHARSSLVVWGPRGLRAAVPAGRACLFAHLFAPPPPPPPSALPRRSCRPSRQ